MKNRENLVCPGEMAVDEEKLLVNMLIVAVKRESKINYQFAKILIVYEKISKIVGFSCVMHGSIIIVFRT